MEPSSGPAADLGAYALAYHAAKRALDGLERDVARAWPPLAPALERYRDIHGLYYVHGVRGYPVPVYLR